MPRTRTFLLLLGVGTSLTRSAFGQDTASCRPGDPGRVAHWHSTWDSVTPDQLRDIANGRADRPDPRGPISVPVRAPKVWVPISLESVYGRWRITARLAQLRSSDTGWNGELRLEAASRSVRRDAPNNGWIRRNRVVQGWLIGRGLVTAFAESRLDSVPVVGYFTPSGTLEIQEGFYVADGGFIEADILGPDRMTGAWSPPGAVVPEFMGWICAARVRETSAQPRDEDAQVYRAVLRYWATCDGQGHDLVADSSAYDQTGDCGGRERARLDVADIIGQVAIVPLDTTDRFRPSRVSKELWRGFLAVDRDTLPLPPLDPIPRVELTRHASGWESPDSSLIRLSRVGYSAGRDSAIVDLFDGCGPLCGSGQGLLLVRRPSGWRVVLVLWFSVS